MVAVPTIEGLLTAVVALNLTSHYCKEVSTLKPQECSIILRYFHPINEALELYDLSTFKGESLKGKKPLMTYQLKEQPFIFFPGYHLITSKPKLYNFFTDEIQTFVNVYDPDSKFLRRRSISSIDNDFCFKDLNDLYCLKTTSNGIELSWGSKGQKMALKHPQNIPKWKLYSYDSCTSNLIFHDDGDFLYMVNIYNFIYNSSVTSISKSKYIPSMCQQSEGKLRTTPNFLTSVARSPASSPFQSYELGMIEMEICKKTTSNSSIPVASNDHPPSATTCSPKLGFFHDLHNIIWVSGCAGGLIIDIIMFIIFIVYWIKNRKSKGRKDEEDDDDEDDDEDNGSTTKDRTSPLRKKPKKFFKKKKSPRPNAMLPSAELSTPPKPPLKNAEEKKKLLPPPPPPVPPPGAIGMSTEGPSNTSTLLKTFESQQTRA